MIKFNQYIDKIGIEFEGLYLNNSSLENLITDNFMFRHVDGSVNNTLGRPYFAYEYVTKPMRQPELNYIIKLYKTFEAKKIYILNYSCGLHFHISLKKTAFGNLCNIDFYNKMVDLFKNKYSGIYEDRKDNHYCRINLTENEKKNQFNKQAYDRYHIVNYSIENNPIDCMEENLPDDMSVEQRQNIRNEIEQRRLKRRQETIEIRFYGGQYATIRELAIVIQDTFNIISEMVTAGKTIKQEIKLENEKKYLFNLPIKSYHNQVIARQNYIIKKFLTNRKTSYIIKTKDININKVINESIKENEPDKYYTSTSNNLYGVTYGTVNNSNSF